MRIIYKSEGGAELYSVTATKEQIAIMSDRLDNGEVIHVKSRAFNVYYWEFEQGNLIITGELD